MRNEFWGQTLQKRTNYVYDTMLATWREGTTTAKSCYVFSFNGKEFALELGTKSMAFQKHHSIDIVNNLRMGFDAQCMVMKVS